MCLFIGEGLREGEMEGLRNPQEEKSIPGPKRPSKGGLRAVKAWVHPLAKPLHALPSHAIPSTLPYKLR